MAQGNLLKVGLLAVIAYELWKRYEPAPADMPLVSDVPTSGQETNSTWIQQLGSTYYGDSYTYNGQPASPFCMQSSGGGDSGAPPAAQSFPAVMPSSDGPGQAGDWTTAQLGTTYAPGYTPAIIRIGESFTPNGAPYVPDLFF